MTVPSLLSSFKRFNIYSFPMILFHIITEKRSSPSRRVVHRCIVSRFSSQPRHAASCVPSELPLVFRRPINLNARSSKGESAAVRSFLRSFVRSLAAVPYSPRRDISLSFLLPLFLSLSRRNELPCTNVAYFLGAAIRFHRAATSRAANYGAKPRAMCPAA